jgi:beta-xylosidase
MTRTGRPWLLAGLFALAGVMLAGGWAAAQETNDMMQNPVITVNFPDPFLLKADDTWYAYATNSGGRNVQTATSVDLVHWDIGRDALPGLPRWVNINRSDVWAPEVIRVGDQYLMFYTARDRTTGYQCIGLAVSDTPQGPFRDRSDVPFVCQPEQGGSIDASPFRDADGTLYLYWKNDGNCCGQRTWLYGQPLADDGLSFAEGSEPVQLIANDRPWKGPVVEAPTMWLQDGQYYLFYSGNVYAGEAYAVGYALCEGPLGPCADAEENPILASDMTRAPLVVGPGHQTVIRDDAGDTWIVYHVWQVSSAGLRTDTRQVWLDRLLWVDGQPQVQGPTREAQPAPVIRGS